MKFGKAVLIALIIVSVAVCFIPTKAIAYGEETKTEVASTYYPLCGIVTEVNAIKDIVVFTTHNGNEWSFEGVEDWITGDIVAVIMSDNGTPETIYDDEIVSARYCGYIFSGKGAGE